MSLVSQLVAQRRAHKLKSSRSLSPAALKQARDELIAMGPEVIPQVLDCLSHGEARGPALEVLDALLNNNTLDTFIACLDSPNPAIVSGVGKVLAGSGRYDAPRLIDVLIKGGRPRQVVETILLAQADAIPPGDVIRALQFASRDALNLMYRLLEQTAHLDTVPELLPLLKSHDPALRGRTAQLLSRFVGESVIHGVTPLLADKDAGVRLEATRALQALGARSAVPALVGCLRDPDLKVQSAAIDALRQLGDGATVPLLLEVLRDEADSSRRAAVEVLNAIANEDAIGSLVEVLRCPDWWVRARAADALGTIGGPRVVEAVSGLLSDDDEAVRRHAVEILDVVADPAAVASLVYALDDADPWVQSRAIDALGKSGDARATQPLLALIERDPNPRLACIRALGAIGDPSAIEPLVALLESADEETRQAIVQALGQVPQKGLPARERTLLHDALTRAQAPLLTRGNSPLRVRARDSRPLPEGSPWSGSPRIESPARGAVQPGSHRAGDSGAGASGARASHGIINFSDLPIDLMLLDRYRVLRRVGSGGFGTVYLVEDTAIQDQLILKILNPHIAMDPKAADRFVQELKLTRKIGHRNVIRVHDFLDLGGARAVSMEYFPGRDLGDVLRAQGKFPPDRALKIAIQVAAGLSAAHAEGILHRDIKPGNILVGPDDLVKVVDFGLASAQQSNASRMTKSGLLIGTPEYMAPEQISGEAADGRADLYSLGIVLYEMLTGTVPFTADTPVKILFQHLEGTAPPLSERAPGVPAEIAALVHRVMARDRDARPADAEALRELLQKARDEFGGAHGQN